MKQCSAHLIQFLAFYRHTVLGTYHRNWIINTCAHGVNSRALCAYIRECAYNAVIFEHHPVTGCLCDE